MSIPTLADYPLPSVGDYPKTKVDWHINSQTSALLIHDMQDYFINFYDPQGQLMPQVIGNIGALRDWCKHHHIPVYYSAQPAKQSIAERGLLTDIWGPGLTANPEQANITVQLTPDASDHILTKWRYSAFYQSDLAQHLTENGKNQLIICGIYAHIGVLQTAAEAFMRNIQPFVIADAVADFSQEDHDYALQYIQRNLGVVQVVDEVIQAS